MAAGVVPARAEKCLRSSEWVEEQAGALVVGSPSEIGRWVAWEAEVPPVVCWNSAVQAEMAPVAWRKLRGPPVPCRMDWYSAWEWRAKILGWVWLGG